MQTQMVGLDLKALLLELASSNADDYGVVKEAVIDALKEIQNQNEIEKQKRSENRKKLLEERLIRKRTGVKSNGVKIATPADPIRCYNDFELMIDALRQSRHGARDAAIFAVGCATGLRGIDILKLRSEMIWDQGGEFRQRAYTIEQKTGKEQEFLITEVIREYLTAYINNLGGIPKGYLFPNEDGSGGMDPNYFSRVVRRAAARCGLPIHMSAHSMRYSFSHVAQAIAQRDSRVRALEGIQIAMNHSSNRLTTGYAKHIIRAEVDAIRTLVSDFLMGKTHRDLMLWELDRKELQHE